MSKYISIRPGMAWDCDVVRCVESVYDDSIASNKWSVHFIERVRFIRIISITNNGKIYGRDSSGSLRFFHASDKKVTGFYRKIA